MSSTRFELGRLWRVICLLSFCALLTAPGCEKKKEESASSSKEESAEKEEGEGVPSDEKGEEGAAANKEDQEEAKAPEPGSVEALAAERDEIEFKPAPAKIAGKEINAEICEYDGDLFLSKEPVTTTAIGDVAWVNDNLYVIDQHQAIRRYKIASGDKCTLTLDKSFGENGSIKMDRPGNIGSDDPMPTPWLTAGSMTSDESGHVFVSADEVWTDGSWRLTGDQVDYYCDQNSGRLSVSKDGKTGFSREMKIKQTSFTDSGCTAEDWQPEGLPEDDISGVFLVDDTVWVSAGNGKELHAYDRNGAAKGVTLGNRDKSLDEAGNICSAFAIQPGNIGQTVVDYNCRALVFFNDDGTPIEDPVKVPELLNPGAYLYPTFSGFTQIEDGTAYLNLYIERGETGDDNNPYQGFIVRLTGL